MNPKNLTRETIEQLNNIEPYCFETNREEQWFNVGLQYGLDVATSNPILPWINVNDDLPCNNPNNIHFGFTNKVFVIDSNKNIFIAYMKKNKNNKWVWCSDDNFDLSHIITHWMPIPELPKE